MCNIVTGRNPGEHKESRSDASECNARWKSRVSRGEAVVRLLHAVPSPPMVRETAGEKGRETHHDRHARGAGASRRTQEKGEYKHNAGGGGGACANQVVYIGAPRARELGVRRDGRSSTRAPASTESHSAAQPDAGLGLLGIKPAPLTPTKGRPVSSRRSAGRRRLRAHMEP